MAATIYAPIQGTLTQQAPEDQAAQPPTATAAEGQPEATEAPPEVTPAPAEPTALSPTQSQGEPYPAPSIQPSEAPAVMLTSVVIPELLTPTANQSAGFPPPTTYVAPFPPGSYTAQAGSSFAIAGVNLPSCGATFTANFLIINHSGSPFKSLSIQMNDLTSGQVIAAPQFSDAPFMIDDRVCYPGGISRLESGYALFVGSTTGAGQLSGHTIQANLLFCTHNGLGGSCFPGTIEFVVP